MSEVIVNEMFYSLQGEGPLMGRPAYFIRLTGCIKPYCSWCDSKHSFEDGDGLPITDVVNRVIKMNPPLVVITGGEPFIQWQSGLNELHQQLTAHEFSIQYETSGRVELPQLKNSTNTTVVCSPKQKQIDSGQFSSNEWDFFPENHKRVDCFKFVFDDNELAIKAFIEKYQVKPENVFIMPEGASREEQMAKMEPAWLVCQKNNWNFAPRLHIITFDQKRGV